VKTFKTPAPESIKSLFSNIAPRYDTLNLLLSFGLNMLWRRRAVKESIRPEDTRLLDVGTGSGKLLHAYLKRQNFTTAVGLDFCEPLLSQAKKRLKKFPNVQLKNQDLLTMEEDEGSFDIISTSFVMRSIAGQMGQFFNKACDLLIPGGRLVILELTRPSNPLLRLLFIPYLKIYLPLLGTIISGDKNAYHFLSDSILHFKNRTEIVELLRQARFVKIDVKLLSGGIGTLFIAQKGQA